MKNLKIYIILKLFLLILFFYFLKKLKNKNIFDNKSIFSYISKDKNSSKIFNFRNTNNNYDNKNILKQLNINLNINILENNSNININKNQINISNNLFFGDDFIYVNKTIKQKEIIYNKSSIRCKVYAIEEDKEELPYNKKIIHVAINFGENYVIYPLVSMTSTMINCDIKNTILIYHFFSENKVIKEMNMLKTIKKKYKENIRLNFYIITNIFSKCSKWRGYTRHYLRLILPELLPKVDKIIYLDGDTLIFKDLTEMYNLPMNDNYVLGFPDIFSKNLRRYGIYMSTYINSGTLLLNLKKIRDDNMSDILLKLLFTKFRYLDNGDQNIINIAYNPKVGLLPLKYGILLIHDINKYIEMTGLKLNYNEFKEAKNNPSILHLTQCEPKILSNATKHYYGRKYDKICKYGRNLFFKYAKFTEYYTYIAKICNFSEYNITL